MKRILTVVTTFFCLLQTAEAQEQRAAMQVKLTDNQLLTVVVDGRHYKRYGSTLTIGNLPAGKHEVKVYRFFPSNDPGYRSFGYNRSHAKLAYTAKIRVENNKMYYVTVDPRYKKMQLRESGMLAADGTANNYPIRSQSVFSDSDDATGNSNNVVYPEQINVLREPKMKSLGESVASKPGDMDKLKQMKQYLETRSLESAQVSAMMDWLNFEATRLDFAKWAYRHVIDQDNYYMVADKLEDKASKEELESFLSGGK